MGMLVKVKGATSMKKLFSIGLVLALLTGCGTSPEEKRNNFDACVIDERAKNKNYEPTGLEWAQRHAEQVCSYLLK